MVSIILEYRTYHTWKGRIKYLQQDKKKMPHSSILTFWIILLYITFIQTIRIIWHGKLKFRGMKRDHKSNIYFFIPLNGDQFTQPKQNINKKKVQSNQ